MFNITLHRHYYCSWVPSIALVRLRTNASDVYKKYESRSSVFIFYFHKPDFDVKKSNKKKTKNIQNNNKDAALFVIAETSAELS